MGEEEPRLMEPLEASRGTLHVPARWPTSPRRNGLSRRQHGGPMARKSRRGPACIARNYKMFGRFSPGCGGPVAFPSGLVQLKDHGTSRALRGRTCRLHYLEYEFGLCALRCPKCSARDRETHKDRIQAATNVTLDDEEKYTYVPVGVLFAPASHAFYLRDQPRAFTVRCWRCGFVFYRKGNVSKAMREENERSFSEDSPGVPPELPTAIREGHRA